MDNASGRTEGMVGLQLNEAEMDVIIAFLLTHPTNQAIVRDTGRRIWIDGSLLYWPLTLSVIQR